VLSSRWQPARRKKFEIEICGYSKRSAAGGGSATRVSRLTSHDLEKKPKKVYSTSTLLGYRAYLRRTRTTVAALLTHQKVVTPWE
jgi:hypothetical protein